MKRSACGLTAMLFLIILSALVAAPVATETPTSVESSTTAEITISVNDSRNGADTATTQIDVRSSTSSAVPSNLQRFTDSNGKLGNLEVLQAVQAANNNNQIGGQPVENLDVLQLVQYVNNNP